MSRLTAGGAHPFGYTEKTGLNGPHGDMRMDFGILRLGKGQEYRDEKPLEKAYLLVYGEVELIWGGERRTAKRRNCFDEAPTVLRVPPEATVTVRGIGPDSELAVVRTDNDRTFGARWYGPGDTPDERRGAGLMGETSTRIVRTVFDYSNAPQSNLVLGEVIGFPGKWSSYPPHHHPQPEIYYYKLNPAQGFGYAELGEHVLKVRHNDTVCIEPGLTHPHCAAPGYALWYLWAIRHLPGDPYITPTFLPEHGWVAQAGAEYWPEKPAGEGNP